MRSRLQIAGHRRSCVLRAIRAPVILLLFHCYPIGQVQIDFGLTAGGKLLGHENSGCEATNVAALTKSVAIDGGNVWFGAVFTDDDTNIPPSINFNSGSAPQLVRIEATA